jgi:hypothetical protein
LKEAVVFEQEQELLDEELDRALINYGNAPKREGLDQRVLARVGERATHARRRLAKDFWMATGLAAIAVGCLFRWAPPKPATQKPATQSQAVLMSEIPARRDLAIVLKQTTRRARFPKRPAPPMLAQFPAPAILGSEERALLRLAAGDAKNVPPELTHFGAPAEPIQITAIEIKPLE